MVGVGVGAGVPTQHWITSHTQLQLAQDAACRSVAQSSLLGLTKAPLGRGLAHLHIPNRACSPGEAMPAAARDRPSGQKATFPRAREATVAHKGLFTGTLRAVRGLFTG